MNRPAPRSIDEYLKQLRAALAGEDPALIQDALYDAEEYLRAEIASHPDKSEADVLELIASTYGAPDEVAAAYVDTEATAEGGSEDARPRRTTTDPSVLRRFFGIYSDPRAYTSLFYMLLTLLTGMVYFTFVVAGLSLSLGLAVLIIGIPFFLAFIGISRVISLGEGGCSKRSVVNACRDGPYTRVRPRDGGRALSRCSRIRKPGRPSSISW